MKAQGQRDLANAKPPSSGARQPAALSLIVSFLHLFPAECHSVLSRAWDTRLSQRHQVYWQVTPAGSATLALQALAAAQTDSTELTLPKSS